VIVYDEQFKKQLANSNMAKNPIHKKAIFGSIGSKSTKKVKVSKVKK